MREAVEVARTDSDTISNVFLSSVKGSVSTFLLESRELTLDDVNCLRSEAHPSGPLLRCLSSTICFAGMAYVAHACSCFMCGPASMNVSQAAHSAKAHMAA